MMKKSDKTRAAILETAKALFSEKGYSAVTMKDFCDRQQISRGGLYRYFASTKEIFTAMLDEDKDQSSQALDEAIQAGIPAKQVFAHFIETQRQAIEQGGGRITIAVYEFCTSSPDQKGYLSSRFAVAVAILSKLIHYGQTRGEFREGDAKEMAGHIVLFLEGLRLSSDVIELSEAELDQQMRFLDEMVVIPDPA